MTHSMNQVRSPGDIFIVGKDGKLNKAHILKRVRKNHNRYGIYTAKYFYLSYRDGHTTRQIYIGKGTT